MKYIDTLDEFTNQINEKHDIKRPKATGNELSAMFGNQKKAGREIFNTINKNVDTLEGIIDDYNKKNKTSIGTNPLEVKIDKTKLDLEYLVSLTKLKKPAFISDIIVSNILNYKILIRPIKNARIIYIAYKYYLAMIRHCLQSALVMIELSSDSFFSQINSNLSGRRKEMKEMMDTIIMNTTDNMKNFCMGQSFIDENGKQRSIKDILSKEQMNEFTKLVKQMNTLNNSRNDFDRINGYNQNVFQDSGRTIESMLKTNQDKELQSLSEQLLNIANSTTGISKESTAKEQISNYANAVKLSAESRAMEVCAQINMNMFEIMKMFTIRNIDGYSDVFTESSDFDKKMKDYDNKMENFANQQAMAEEENEREIKKQVSELTKNINDEDKNKQLIYWKNKGFENLCSPDELKKIVYANGNLSDILKKNNFNDSQIYNIIHNNENVNDYDKLYYGDLSEYFKNDKSKQLYINGNLITLDTVNGKNDDDIFCWMRKDSAKYKTIKNFIKNNE